MFRCPIVKKCPFFNDELEKRPVEAFQYKRTYCLGNYAACARYLMHRSLNGRVPTNLFPNQIEVARAMLQRMGVEPKTSSESRDQSAAVA